MTKAVSPQVDNIPPFRENRPLQFMVAWLVFFWVLTAIAPYDRFDWLLENLLVFFYGALLVVTYRYFRFSNAAYALLTVFLTLHLIGAHYTYSETPFGFWLQEWFELKRNHYDRLVHFAYGLLLACPARELLLRLAHSKPMWSSFLAINMVLAFSAFFEIVEMWIAQLVSPELGAAYLGTQGDIWDAQRDMFLAFAGAVIAIGLRWLMARRLRTLAFLSASP